MKNNALSIANTILSLADKEGRQIKPLALMKLVYIAYGYALAYLVRNVIDPRFDRVEAWKYGPVIPSVYHSFKHFQNSPIKEKAVILTDDLGKTKFVVPYISDPELLKAVEKAWNDHKDFSDSQLVNICHKEGSPWNMIYQAGKNNEIPEKETQKYYMYILGIISDNSESTYKDYMLKSVIGAWSDIPDTFAEQIIKDRNSKRTRPAIEL